MSNIIIIKIYFKKKLKDNNNGLNKIISSNTKVLEISVAHEILKKE